MYNISKCLFFCHEFHTNQTENAVDAIQIDDVCLAAVVVVIVRINGSPATIEFDGGRAAWNLLIQTLQQLHKVFIVQFAWQLSHLCHTTNHALHHLRLLRFTDFQCVYCVENIGNVLWLCVCIFINRFHLHLARAFWSIIWLRIECLASSCWRARSCWAFCCASALPPPPPCRPHNGNNAFEN